MYKTKVIISKSQVPEGFVNIQEWNHDMPAKRRLSHAHGKGSIRAYKLMRTVNDIRGSVFVHKQDAEKYLDEMDNGKLPLFQQKPKQPNELILAELKRISEIQEMILAKLD